MTSRTDPWARLRAATPARIGLGRAGDGLPTPALLDFQEAHARARDAVHGCMDVATLKAALAPRPCLDVHSQAPDRATYLRRPDLGRRLRDEDAARLTPGETDAVFILGDGLSASAVMTQAVPTLLACLERLPGWRFAPIVLAAQARVGLSDAIGQALNVPLAVILLGERPGLSVADSLGAYLTWNPGPGRTDSQRNCVSNIHAAGLGHEAAADRIAWLMREARSRRLTGVGLKDESGQAVLS